MLKIVPKYTAEDRDVLDIGRWIGVYNKWASQWKKERDASSHTLLMFLHVIL